MVFKIDLLEKNNDIFMHAMESIPGRDIFTYLLQEFMSEYDECEMEIEEEENKQPINRKNAGGYTPGVLHNYVM